LVCDVVKIPKALVIVLVPPLEQIPEQIPEAPVLPSVRSGRRHVVPPEAAAIPAAYEDDPTDKTGGIGQSVCGLISCNFGAGED